MKKIKHKIGLHGAVGILVRKGNKVVRVCTECNEEIVDNKKNKLTTNNKIHKEGFEAGYIKGYKKGYMDGWRNEILIQHGIK